MSSGVLGYNSVYMDEECIYMSDRFNNEQYLIYQGNTDYNCVRTYTIHGGSEQPFEFVTMEIVRKQLTVLAPDLVDEIYPGRNHITILGMGQAEYIVTKCKRTSTGWTITAYSVMEQIRGFVLDEDLSFSTSPVAMISTLVQTNAITLTSNGYMESVVQSTVFCVMNDKNSWTSETDRDCFEKGTSVWYVIQTCALKLNAKVWLARGTLYIVDTTIQDPSASTVYKSSGFTFDDIDYTLYLNKEGSFPYNPTPEQEDILFNIIQTPTVGDDGVDVIRNVALISYDGGDGLKYIPPDVEAEGMEDVVNSIATYLQRTYTYSISGISEADAKKIANSASLRYCDAETAVTFQMRETIRVDDNGVRRTKWIPWFTPLTRVKKVIDYTNDLVLSVKCNFSDTIMMQKGMLSRIETKFPEHITSYTFGISAPTDMTQNNSIILNSLTNS